MSEDKSKTGIQDRLRIDRNDPSEVSYVAQKFGCSSQEVIDAMEKAGTDNREKVYEILKRSRS